MISQAPLYQIPVNQATTSQNPQMQPSVNQGLLNQVPTNQILTNQNTMYHTVVGQTPVYSGKISQVVGLNTIYTNAATINRQGFINSQNKENEAQSKNLVQNNLIYQSINKQPMQVLSGSPYSGLPLNNSNQEYRKPSNEVNALLTKNLVFIRTSPLPKEKSRQAVPKGPTIKKTTAILSLVKELIGKDLTRVSLPVWLNEPLSTLQRTCERMENANLLFTANDQQDSCLRLAYCMAFGFAGRSNAHPNRKKPFNPILGETFEFAPPDGSYKFLCEQVSHHPPISAEFTDSASFQLWSATNSKVNFKGNHLEVNVRGTCHTLLKRHNDHVVHNSPIFTINNLLAGTKYVDYMGEVLYQNLTTGDIGVMTMTKRGHGGKGAFEATGIVKDRNGNIRYKLHGKWNSYLMLVDLATNQETRIWQKAPVGVNFEDQYCFTQFAKQLNYLTEETASKLPKTDSRLRPDQRALEFGLLDLATSEKSRLEDKQRKRAADLKSQGQLHQPRWFREVQGSSVDNPTFEYLGGYWESREKGDFGQNWDVFGA